MADTKTTPQSRLPGSTATCPVCGKTSEQAFLRWPNVIAHQQQLPASFDAAIKVARGDIRLHFCTRCAMIWNDAFNLGTLDYSLAYDASQNYSGIFRDYVSKTAARLIGAYDLTSQEILEVGCGDGSFLETLCRLGNNSGTGFDPGLSPQVTNATDADVCYIRDYYSENYADHQGELLICRHVLEHIPEPGEFIQTLVRATEKRNPVFFFEVPNIFWSLERDAFWDIYYEHCLYFGYHSLVNLFVLNGFECLAAGEGFGGQYVWIDARHRPGTAENAALPQVPQLLVNQVNNFTKRYQALLAQWQQRINETIASGKTRLVLWGAGARAVTFLNLTGFTREQIEYVVDINPAKHGLYIPGTGQQIVSPQFLAEYQPDTVIGTNPAYRDEIQTLMRQEGISGNFMTISV